MPPAASGDAPAVSVDFRCLAGPRFAAGYGRFLSGKGSKRENRKSENRKSKIYSLLKYFNLPATYTKNLSSILI